MVIEEPSVVAAASKGAKTARVRGGFAAEADGSYSTGQIQVLGAGEGSAARLAESEPDILRAANAKSSTSQGSGRAPGASPAGRYGPTPRTCS